MSKDTFSYLCEKLGPSIEHQDTSMRKAVGVGRRVGITLWCLATCSEYRTIGHLFGVARSTVCVIVHETCAAIVNVLLEEYISFPTGSKLARVLEGFKDKWNVPQCAGAIDGSHIPVRPPACHHTDYYNRKGWYSVILQAVVDHNYLFLDVMVGWPGSVHDARVLANSKLYLKARNKEILNTNSANIRGTEIFPYLIGDSAYPLNTWLLKPFPHHSLLTDKQKSFNYQISRARIVSENAFGRLKGRWRRLAKQNDMFVEKVPQIVLACCILHNLCEVHGDTFCSTWLQCSTPTQLQQPARVSTSISQTSATLVRDTLVQYMT